MKTVGWITSVVFALLIAGCMTGPDYKKPEVAVPDAWSESLQGGEKADTPQLSQWWKLFGDPTLDALIARAIDSNYDLRAAEARIREARANQQATGAGLWPQLNTSGAYQRTLSKEAPASGGIGKSISLSAQGASVSVTGSPAGASGPSVTLSPDFSGGGNGRLTIASGQGGGAPGRQNDLFQTGFDASWELDIFGGTRRAMEAAQADTEAAEESRRDIQVTLAAEIARNYLMLRLSQSLLDITNNNLRIQQESLTLVQSRFEAGLTNELDVKRAEAQLAVTQSTVPGLETETKQAIHRLGVLLGKGPGALQDELSPAGSLPSSPPEVPVGLPSDLLRRRPDVRRAERELAASTARIGVAMADLFPKFSLTGSISANTNTFSGLTRGANQLGSIGPSISWPIFDAGRIRANIEVQNARQEQALLAYEKSVMSSMEDVENALVAYAKEQARMASLQVAMDANRRAVSIASELYANGLVNYLNVLDAERSLFATEAQHTQSKATILTNLVALYKALGGGWEEIPAAS